MKDHYVNVGKLILIPSGRGAGKTALIEALMKLPEEDVEPVIHAHWITCGIFDDFVKCSHCGWKAPFSLIGDFNIVGCPGCRAKMDEERKNEENK